MVYFITFSFCICIEYVCVLLSKYNHKIYIYMHFNVLFTQ